MINEETPVFTTVNDLQIINTAPKDEHDFVVDAIITPSKVVRIKRKYSQPKGIIWEKLTKQQLNNMTTLHELTSFDRSLSSSSLQLPLKNYSRA